MKIFVPKEINPGEKRVALVPDVISKLTRAGFEVVIESGAGIGAGAGDKEFVTAGAQVVASGDVASSSSQIVASSDATK
ncbi:MAG: NAD(P)(+) transhydrogenase (Re/Si-specific) subunit alpha, partial [Actinomycetota bacterium]